MPIAHQPGSVPVEIPEQIPNPAVRPAAPPNPEPRPERKEPVKVPERVPASRVARDGFRHWSRPLQRAGSYDHRLSWLTNKKPGQYGQTIRAPIYVLPLEWPSAARSTNTLTYLGCEACQGGKQN